MNAPLKSAVFVLTEVHMTMGAEKIENRFERLIFQAGEYFGRCNGLSQRGGVIFSCWGGFFWRRSPALHFECIPVGVEAMVEFVESVSESQS